jgi:hypothetical protein
MSICVVRKRNVAKKAALATAGVAILALYVVGTILNSPAVQAQSPRIVAKFEVASIKPCHAEDNPGKKSGGGGGIAWTPERLHVGCATLENLIRNAYLSYPEGKPWAAATRAEPTPEAFGVHGVAAFSAAGESPRSPSGSFTSLSREARTGPIPIATRSTRKPKALPLRR